MAISGYFFFKIGTAGRLEQSDCAVITLSLRDHCVHRDNLNGDEQGQGQHRALTNMLEPICDTTGHRQATLEANLHGPC